MREYCCRLGLKFRYSVKDVLSDVFQLIDVNMAPFAYSLLNGSSFIVCVLSLLFGLYSLGAAFLALSVLELLY